MVQIRGGLVAVRWDHIDVVETYFRMALLTLRRKLQPDVEQLTALKEGRERESARARARAHVKVACERGRGGRGRDNRCRAR